MPEISLISMTLLLVIDKSNVKNNHDETRTRNLLIRSQTPYPLGHAVMNSHV